MFMWIQPFLIICKTYLTVNEVLRGYVNLQLCEDNSTPNSTSQSISCHNDRPPPNSVGKYSCLLYICLSKNIMLSKQACRIPIPTADCLTKCLTKIKKILFKNGRQNKNTSLPAPRNLLS